MPPSELKNNASSISIKRKTCYVGLQVLIMFIDDEWVEWLLIACERKRTKSGSPEKSYITDKSNWTKITKCAIFQMSYEIRLLFLPNIQSVLKYTENVCI